MPFVRWNTSRVQGKVEPTMDLMRRYAFMTQECILTDAELQVCERKFAEASLRLAENGIEWISLMLRGDLGTALDVSFPPLEELLHNAVVAEWLGDNCCDKEQLEEWLAEVAKDPEIIHEN